MALPQHLTDLMDDENVFTQGHGLLDEEPFAGDVRVITDLLREAEISAADGNTQTARDRLMVVDVATRALATSLQKRLGSKVRYSACLGLARSLVETAYQDRLPNAEVTQ